MVLVIGLALAGGWIAMLHQFMPLTLSELILSLTTGALSAVGASIATLIVARRTEPDREHFDQVTYDARHDALTGLPNRPELFRLLELAIDEAHSNNICLLYTSPSPRDS